MTEKNLPDRQMRSREKDIKRAVNGMTIPKLIEYLSGLDLPEDATICIEREWDYDEYDAKVVIEYWTEETDEEYQTRTRQEHLRAEQDRRLYEALKKRFEGDIK